MGFYSARLVVALLARFCASSALMRVAGSVRGAGRRCLLIGTAVLLHLAMPSDGTAADCADIFPDGVQNSNNSGSITFESGTKLVNSPDNSLETNTFTDNAGSNTSCDGVSCTVGGSIASTATWSSFPGGDVIQISGSGTLSPGDYQSIEVYSSGTITLEPGEYTVKTAWNSYSSSNIIVSGSGTARIYMEGNIYFYSSSNINGSDSADRLFMFAGGDIEIYSSSVVKGFFVAEGSLTTSSSVSLEGAITVNGAVYFDSSSTITFDQTALDATDFDTYCTVGAAAPHFAISHDGSAEQCQAETVTISAHDTSHVVDTAYVGTITLSTSTSKGDWSLVSGAGVLTNSGSGSATYVYDGADNGSVQLGLLDNDAETLNIDVTDGTYSEYPSEDASLTFASASVETFRDEFNAVSYSGSDGTATWATDWLEINESDGPSSGDERVTSDSGSNRIRVKDNDGGGEGVEREADLSTFATATLTFVYRRDGLDDSSDYVTVDVSANGGSSWTELDRFAGSATDSDYVSASYDISAYLASNTRIRFLSSSSMGGSDKVWFDDVQISADTGATCGGGGGGGGSCANSADSWWDNNWLNRVEIVFDNSASSELLASFPVLVSLTGSDISFADTEDDGADLRFVDSDGSTTLDAPSPPPYQGAAR